MFELAVWFVSLGKGLITVMAVVLGFGVLIFVHELGHFLFAKWVGIRVDAFALGFGPKIIGIRRGQTEYRLNWMPFGGYCKLAGMEGDDDKNPQEIEGGFYAAARWRRALCVTAGPVFNLIFALLVFSVLWMTGVVKADVEDSTVIAGFDKRHKAQIGALREGDEIKTINGKPITKWQHVIEAIVFAKTDEFEIKVRRLDKALYINGIRITQWTDITRAVLFPDTAKTSVLYSVEYKAEIVKAKSAEDKELGVYRLGIRPKISLVVDTVLKKSLAEKMGLKKGDEVLSILDRETVGFLNFIGELREEAGENVEVTFLLNQQEASLDEIAGMASEEVLDLLDFKKKLKKNIGREVRITVLRGGPEGRQIALKCRVPEIKKGEKYPILGFQPSQFGRLVRVYETPTESVGKVLGMTYRTLGRLFARGKVRVKPKALTGPIGILNLIKVMVWLSFSSYVWFIAFLSVNLGILNLLPIPVLDGGHLVFTGIEAVVRRPLNEKAMALITNVFAVALISFMVYISYHDVRRFIVPSVRRWFGIEKKIEEPGDEKDGTKEKPENRKEGPGENGESSTKRWRQWGIHASVLSGGRPAAGFSNHEKSPSEHRVVAGS